jgi:hypothetical protein
MNPPTHSPLFYRAATYAAFALFSQAALAWGPHPEITQAALRALGTEDGIYKHLGADTGTLTQYVWMADWRTQLLTRSDDVFYADDYLLFPKAKSHSQHICPEVRQTYAPFFRRALQALRTESPRNAARWVGSLLHFTTDTGSPPHAAGFLGPAHSKMENWLDAKLIQLPGYQPRLLGDDDVSAEAGFISRMDGLIEFSKERAARCRADVDADRREPVEPVVLESALETARVTADLLHTLGVLAGNTAAGVPLSGKVRLPNNNHPTLDRLPAKVVLLGTDFSTLTAPDGSFLFQHLPVGDYHMVALAPGATSTPMAVSLKGGGLTIPELTLMAGKPGNLLRNADFQLHWSASEAPDHWTKKTPPGKLAGKTPMRDWDGEWLPLENGAIYSLEARWKKGATGVEDTLVFVRFKPAASGPAVPTESEPLNATTDRISVRGTPEAGWAQVCIRAAHSPEAVLEAVHFRRHTDPGTPIQ